MNIGMFTDTYLPDINGVVSSLTRLENELEKRGHHVYIFTTTKHVPQPGKHNVYTLHSLPLITNKEYRVASVISKKLEEAIVDLHIELIHTHTEFLTWTFARRMADKYNIKMVHTYHTMWEDYTHYIPLEKLIRPKNAKLMTRKYIQRCGSHSASLIAPTQKTKHYLTETCGFPADMIHVVPSGIDLDNFQRETWPAEKVEEVRRDFGFGPNDKVLVFVGRVAKEKSIEVLIAGMPALVRADPSYALLIVGFGPSESELKEQVETLLVGNRVKFTGRIPYDQIGLYYNAADAFVMASVTETQGLTYIEAMAAGLPVIAKYDASIEDLIKTDENGVFFKNNDEFPDAVQRVFTDSELNARIRRGAVETSKIYSKENFAMSIEKIYMNLLGIN